MNSPHRPLSFDDAPSFSDDNYRAALQFMLSDRLIHLARHGWAPDDLRHVAGPTIDPHLRSVLRQVTAVASDRIRAAWQRQCRPPSLRRRPLAPVSELEPLLEAVDGLPCLSGTDDLTDLACLQSAGADTLTPEQQRARHRITGLLKKAESTTFSEEAETLIAKAQQLRQRYRIDSLDGDDTAPGAVVTVRIHLTAPWVRFQHLLLANIAVANSCRAILSTEVGIAALVGHPDDVQHTAELFASLNRQRDHFMRHSPGAAAAAHRGETAAYRRSFLQSYAYRIGDLLTEATSSTETSPEEQARALPVLAKRSVIAEEAFARIFPHTATLSMSHRFHAPGATDGIRAAERSHLGPERTAVGGA